MANKLNRYDFIWNAIQVHGYKYNYSKVDYINFQTKVCIICPEHGEFWQTPNHHIYRKQGCKKCSDLINQKNRSNTTEQFIKQSITVHENKYDYSKVEYLHSKIKVCIICKKHGEFWQTPNHHLKGEGCSICKNNILSIVNNRNNDEFIKLANIIHNGKYNYLKTEYKSCKEKINIICPKHGGFWQTPDAHLQGQGCPICNESKLEKEVSKFLDEKRIIYERQKRFKWLGRQSLDFYLPMYQIGIECQGEQHFNEINFGQIHNIKHQKELDKKKNNLCKENGVFLFYYIKPELFHVVIDSDTIDKDLYNEHSILYTIDDFILL